MATLPSAKLLIANGRTRKLNDVALKMAIAVNA
jgi:hypothetical protein